MTPALCDVRTARSDDLEAVLALYSRADPAHEARGSATDQQKQTWRRMMATTDLTVYLGEAGGEVVGTATALVMPNVTYACAPTVFVEAVVVAPSYRRRGIATAMLQRILVHARAAGCNKVQLLSHKRHATDGAHRLYGALGFEPEAKGFRLYLQEPPATVRTAKAP
jgi:GNAT superfamily N-acetyltransferase